MMEIFNDDCFNVFDRIENKIDLVLVDLPYGQTDLYYDIKIDLKKMWKELINIISNNCTLVFFCTTKFGYELIKSNPEWFRYDLVWEKSRGVGYLNSNLAPLRIHEMIYIFQRPMGKDIGNNFNLDMREYFNKILKYIKKTSKQVEKDLGHRKAEHAFYKNTTQFSLCTEETYKELIEKYKIDKMPNFKKYEELTTNSRYIYNPQMTKGKPYKCNNTSTNKVYNTVKIPCDNKGTRFPKSVLKYNNIFKETLHENQKPTDLLEWLIKTYSEEDDIVLDFTMGSGSCGVACQNTNRKFIGIEKDKKIFKTAKKRLKN